MVPVYRNEGTVAALVERLAKISTELDGRFEAVFVIDGSPDRSGAMLRELLKGAGIRARLVWHSRNFGSFAAIRSGLREARGEVIAVMAADLQEPVELIREFQQALAGGAADVALGTRRSRPDGGVSSGLFWRLYRRFVQPDMPPGGVDMFACTRQVRDVLLTLNEANGSLVGLLIWLGYRRVLVPYDRAPRAHGDSGWSFRRKVRYLFDSVYSFTDLPITLLLWVGVTGVFVSLTVSLVVFIAWLTGRVQVAGYTPLMLSSLIGISVVVSGLGIVGSYVWRTYENTKVRPNAVSMLTEAFGD